MQHCSPSQVSTCHLASNLSQQTSDGEKWNQDREKCAYTTCTAPVLVQTVSRMACFVEQSPQHKVPLGRMVFALIGCTSVIVACQARMNAPATAVVPPPEKPKCCAARRTLLLYFHIYILLAYGERKKRSTDNCDV